MIDPKIVADRYIALWNEPDAKLRCNMIHELWAVDGVQFLQPPQEIHETAATLGLTPILQARGHDELEVRVSRSYEQFVAAGEFRFRLGDDIGRLGNVVKFSWEMVPTGGGDAAGGGLEFLLLDDDGRIRHDYQFIN